MRYFKDLYRPGKALPGIFGASPPHRAAQPPFALFLGDGPMRDAGDPYRAPDLQKPVERVSARANSNARTGRANNAPNHSGAPKFMAIFSRSFATTKAGPRADRRRLRCRWERDRDTADIFSPRR